MPFDRLIRTIDEWAQATGRTDCFAQIGPSKFSPEHISYTNFLEPQEFRQCMAEASGVVAHAGMGTILMALEIGLPILVLPRLARLRETRNDHQTATARHLADAGLVLAARDEMELPMRLAELETSRMRTPITRTANADLLGVLRRYALD